MSSSTGACFATIAPSGGAMAPGSLLTPCYVAKHACTRSARRNRVPRLWIVQRSKRPKQAGNVTTMAKKTRDVNATCWSTRSDPCYTPIYTLPTRAILRIALSYSIRRCPAYQTSSIAGRILPITNVVTSCAGASTMPFRCKSSPSFPTHLCRCPAPPDRRVDVRLIRALAPPLQGF